MGDSLFNYVSKLFDIVSSTKFQKKYLQDSYTILQVKSALYVLQDTQQVIDLYLSNDLSGETANYNRLQLTALDYLHVYGILQSLYLQQDAARILRKTFNKGSLPKDKYSTLKKIRDIRNHCIGHPADRYDEGLSFIAQGEVSQYRFKYVDFNDGKPEPKSVDIKELIEKQNTIIEKFVHGIFDQLSTED